MRAEYRIQRKEKRNAQRVNVELAKKEKCVYINVERLTGVRCVRQVVNQLTITIIPPLCLCVCVCIGNVLRIFFLSPPPPHPRQRSSPVTFSRRLYIFRGTDFSQTV